MSCIAGLFRRLFKLLIILAVIVSVILLVPNLPPYTTFSSIEHEPTLPRTGALAPNNLLNNPEKLFEGKLLGPEMFQIWNGEVYTGLATGEIVKVSPQGHVTFVTKIGKPCSGLIEEHICGRPLGFVIDDKSQQMYVADAYYGIWKIDLKSDKKQVLVSPNVPIEGRIPKMFNAVALGKNGEVYWTDSSSQYQLKDGSLITLSNPTGRLFQYNPVKKENKVLVDNLWVANGVVVSPDNEFVLVAESAGFRILKHFINGPKTGKTEVFIGGLPGLPDTIRVLPDGSGVLVALYTVFDDEDPLIIKSLSTVPLARKFFARALHLIENSFDFINTHFPHPILENIVYNIGHFASTSWLLPDQSGLVQIDWNGKIIASYYNTDKTLPHISDAIVFGDKLYTGAPHVQNFIGAVPAPPLLKKAFTIVTPKYVKPIKDIKVEKEPLINKEIKKPQENKPTTQKPQEIPKPVKVEKSPPKPTPQQASKAEPKPGNQAETPTQQRQASSDKKVEKPKENNAKENININKPKVKPQENKVKPTEKREAEVKTNEKSNIKSKDTPKPTSQENVKVKETSTQPKSTPNAKAKPVNEASNTPQAIKESEIKPKTKDSEPSPNKVENNKKRESQEAPKVTKPAPTKKSVSADKITPKADNVGTPIVEEIPSDTAKPPKEPLKVIKKTGPQEIPNPNL